MECFLRYEFGGLYLERLIHGGAYFWNFTVPYSEPVRLAGQARLISCFLIQFSLCLLYMRPGNEVAGWPGLPRSQLFEPRSREVPTSPPLACEYSRLSSFLVPLGTFHQEGGHKLARGPPKKEERHNF